MKSSFLGLFVILGAISQGAHCDLASWLKIKRACPKLEPSANASSLCHQEDVKKCNYAFNVECPGNDTAYIVCAHCNALAAMPCGSKEIFVKKSSTCEFFPTRAPASTTPAPTTSTHGPPLPPNPAVDRTLSEKCVDEKHTAFHQNCDCRFDRNDEKNGLAIECSESDPKWVVDWAAIRKTLPSRLNISRLTLKNPISGSFVAALTANVVGAVNYLSVHDVGNFSRLEAGLQRIATTVRLLDMHDNEYDEANPVFIKSFVNLRGVQILQFLPENKQLRLTTEVWRSYLTALAQLGSLETLELEAVHNDSLTVPERAFAKARSLRLLRLTFDNVYLETGALSFNTTSKSLVVIIVANKKTDDHFKNSEKARRVENNGEYVSEVVHSLRTD
jgi:FtsZ-binding cell division protein ZapB